VGHIEGGVKFWLSRDADAGANRVGTLAGGLVAITTLLAFISLTLAELFVSLEIVLQELLYDWSARRSERLLLIALPGYIRVSVAFLTEWSVFTEHTHGPRASLCVHSFAHVVKFLKLNTAIVELVQVAGRTLREEALMSDLRANALVAPLEDLGQVVNAIQVVISLDMAVFFHPIPREDNIKVVPEVPLLTS